MEVLNKNDWLFVPGSDSCLGTNRRGSVGGVEAAESMYLLGITVSLDQDVDVWRVERPCSLV